MSVTTDGIRQQEMELEQHSRTSRRPGWPHRHPGRWRATMAASEAGLASSVVAGFVGLVVGIFIGVAAAPPRR
jgi:hypothetical protein